MYLLRIISRFTALSLFVAIILLAQNSIFAAKIESISIMGLRRVDKYDVMSRLNFKVGDDVKEGDISTAIKILYLTQYFSKINVEVRSGVLHISVVENPIVNEVLFGGITKKYAEQIKEEMKLQQRGVYTRDKVKYDSERIRIIFQKLGRLNVKVIPKIETLERNRVNVLFDVQDGEMSRVDSVFFVGNKFLSGKTLKSSISHNGATFFKIFRGKIFEEDVLDVDASGILQSYVNNGFPNAAINYIVSEYERVTRNFAITYSISEGDLYFINSVSISSEIEGLNITDLENKVIKIKPSDKFSQREIEHTKLAITQYLYNIGYAFIEIDPIIRHNESDKTTDVQFIIRDASLVYIGRINILGTKRTNDHIARRELLFKEGDLYNKRLVQKSKIKLQILHYFDLVEIRETKGAKPNTVDVDIVLRDLKQTGNTSFSIGYSTFESLILNVGASKSNIGGYGYNGSFSTILSLWRRTISIGFSNAHFLGTNLNFGFDITYNNIDPIGGGSLLPLLAFNLFKQNSVIVAMRLGYPITERLFHSWALQYRYDSLSFGGGGIGGGLYADQVSQETKSTSVTHTLSYDRRDNAILPNKGFFLSLTQAVGLPLPHQLHYQSNDIMAGLYIPLKKDNSWVFSITAKGGAIFGYNDSVAPFQYRYALGYYNMRGFYFSGVGPHVAVSEIDAGGNVVSTKSGGAIGIRGNYYYVTSFELRLPTPLPKEYGLNLVAFVDIGSSFGVDGVPLSAQEAIGGPYDKQTRGGGHMVQYVVDSAMPRVAVGAGLLYMSPMGPIRIEFAAAVVKQAFDTPLVVRIHFSGSPI